MADVSLNLLLPATERKSPQVPPSEADRVVLWSGRKPSCGPSQLIRSLHPKLEKWALCWGLQARDEAGTAGLGLGHGPAHLHPGSSAFCRAVSQQLPQGLQTARPLMLSGVHTLAIRKGAF